MRTLTVLSALLVFLSGIFSAHSAEPELPKILKGGEGVPALPDYSHAGYRYGEVEPPHIEGPVFRVAEYGALPNDNKEDRVGVQAAIQAAEEAGGGVVLFGAGRYLLNEDPDNREPIRIQKPGIVLRGVGSGNDGTHLFMRHPLPPPDPKKGWAAPYLFTFSLPPKDRPRRVVACITEDATLGEKRLQVSDTSKLAAGQTVLLYMEGKAANERLLAGRTPHPDWTGLTEKGFRFQEQHIIGSVQGNTLILREPLHIDIVAEEDWQVRTTVMAEGWGVEDLHFQGNFKEDFVHHKNWLHDYGYSMVMMRYGINCWIRRCRFTDATRCARFNRCQSSSMLNCLIDGNAGHSSFENTGGYGNLIGLCADRSNKGYCHGPNASHESAGFVVWRYDGHPGSGPDYHANNPYMTLWDASATGLFGVGGNRKNLPHHLHGLTWWNLRNLEPEKKQLDFWAVYPDSKRYPRVTIVNPIVIGLHGQEVEVKPGKVLYMESQGNAVQPASLYEYQLKKRLGELPGWLSAIQNSSR